jgi:hypothetical protein
MIEVQEEVQIKGCKLTKWHGEVLDKKIITPACNNN